MGACSRYRLFLMADIWRKPYSEMKQGVIELHFSMKVNDASNLSPQKCIKNKNIHQKKCDKNIDIRQKKRII